MHLVDARVCQGLLNAGGPANLHPIYARCFAKSKMQPPLILRAESASARNLLELFLSRPEDAHLCPNRAPVTPLPLQVEFNPMLARSYRIFVQQQRASLISHDHVQGASVLE